MINSTNASNRVSRIRTLIYSDRHSDRMRTASRSLGVSDLSVRRDVAVARAYDEFCRRAEAGEAIDADQFCNEHAEFRTALYRRIELHRFFEENPDALEQLEPIPWPKVGDEFGECTLVEELGFGGAARVFLAEEDELSRLVVLKVVAGDNGEAERLCRLKHPSIVPIYYVKQTKSFLTAICMPFESRYTLNDFLDAQQSQPFPPKRFGDVLKRLFPDASFRARHGVDLPHMSYVDGVLTLGRQLAEALEHSHLAGIYHLDLKPSNVLVKSDGTPLLIDFNLSAMAGQTAEVFGGTKPYMSPEQLRRLLMPFSQEVPELDGKSDVYSLGVMIAQILTGEHPFGPVSWKGTEQQLLLRQQEWGPSELKRFKGVDAQIRRLLADCLVVDPEQRMDATELADRFKAILQKRRGRPLSRRRYLMISVVLVAAAGLAGKDLFAPQPPVQKSFIGDADWVYGEALQYFDAGDYGEAIEWMSRSIELDSSKAEVWGSRALARLIAQQSDHFRQDALTDYDQAYRLSDEDPEYLAGLGFCRAITGRCPVAESELSNAIGQGLTSAEVYTVLGYCQKSLTQFDKAEESFKKALELNPELPSALYQRAVNEVMRKQGDKLKALTYIRAALKFALDDGPVHPMVPFWAANIAAQCSDNDPDIFGYLEMALESGLDPKHVMLGPPFLKIRRTPEFRALLERTRSVAIVHDAPPLPHPNGRVNVSPVSGNRTR